MARAAIVRCPNCGTRNRVPVVARGVPRCGRCRQAVPWIVDADAGEFDDALAAPVPVFVDFWAPWCGPCRMVSPAVERLGEAHAGGLKVVKLNVDDAPAVAARYGVQGIPLLVLVRGGQEVDRLVGAAPEAQLRRWLERHLGASAGAPPNA